TIASNTVAAKPRLTYRPQGVGSWATGITSASIRARLLTPLEDVLLPQAPSGAFSASFRKPAAGPRGLTLRQSLGSTFSGNGTFTMRLHSGQGICLPAWSTVVWMVSSQKGHGKSSVVAAGAGAAAAGSSLKAAAASASTSADRWAGSGTTSTCW